MTDRVKVIVHMSTNKNIAFITDKLLNLCLEPIYEVAGKYDIMLIIAVANIDVLDEILNQIKSISGVRFMKSAVILRETYKS